jgi:adenosine deaminase CECR1
MGTICSNVQRDDAEIEKDANKKGAINRHTSRLVKKTHRQTPQPIALYTHDQVDMDLAQKMINAHDSIIAERSSKAAQSTVLDRRVTRSNLALSVIKDVDDYQRQRDEIQRRESTIAFDFRLTVTAPAKERRVNAIIQALRLQDEAQVYAAAPARAGYGGQLHPRFAGDHFLSNVDLIKKTKLFAIAKRMPKGAHLHIHFNACLLPHVLLDIAKKMDRMFITSDLALTDAQDHLAFDRCEIQFSILPPEKEKPGDLFSASYEPRQTMRISTFLDKFPQMYSKATADEWLRNKLVFNEEEAHDWLQTTHG